MAVRICFTVIEAGKRRVNPGTDSLRLNRYDIWVKDVQQYIGKGKCYEP